MSGFGNRGPFEEKDPYEGINDNKHGVDSYHDTPWGDIKLKPIKPKPIKPKNS